MSAENSQIARHSEYLENPKIRQQLFAQFAPVFCFHPQEKYFPLHPDAFVQNVIEVKYAEYKKREKEKSLTFEESQEREIIKKYFWKDDKFNPDYKDYEKQTDFKAMMGIDPKKKSKFLVFDEKKYGYRVGEKIKVPGVYPPDHPKHDSSETAAPTATSIIPTEKGFYISFEYTYALNDAIKGLRWLRDLLPSKWADKLDNCGLHYGDCEGVGMYVTVNDEGVASLESMQTFAHGRDGAREVPAADCTYRDGRPCVFVGLGGHPSYADNFVGRNRFIDVVGDAYHITPTIFNDVSPDKRESKSADMLPAWCTFPRLADSNPIAFSKTCCPLDAEDLTKQAEKWHRYKPVLFLTRAWNWIKKKIQEKRGLTVPQSTQPLLDLKKIDDAISIDTCSATFIPVADSIDDRSRSQNSKMSENPQPPSDSKPSAKL